MHGTTENPNWRPATQAVRGGLERSPFEETSEALYLTSGYVYGSAAEAERAFKGETDRYIYSRYGNPTVTAFETRLALLEGASRCFSTASGMAAVFAALMCCLQSGGRIVAARALFGSCHHIVANILPRYGINSVFVDGTDLDQWEAALATGADCVFLETPSNPALEIIDLEAVAALAHGAGAQVVVDNVFATPVLQRPMDRGADIVVYSTTKHIDGQGRTLGGAILTDDVDWYDDHLEPFMRHTGPALSPFNAWVLVKGLETLDLRVRRQCENAETVACFLEAHEQVERVLYPALSSHPQHDLAMAQMAAGGTVVAFSVRGGRDGAFAVLDGLGLVDISNNLGDAKSLITHPATTTHQRLSPEDRAAVGISDGLVRLSVGLEDVADLTEDLDQALRNGANR
jgi:O-succinylhomoserine sulfhydrylase